MPLIERARRYMFQSAPLREGRSVAQTLAKRLDLRFNPRPCGRGDALQKMQGSGNGIVSIRAPAGGAIANSNKIIVDDDRFNPRPCGRGDGQTFRVFTKIMVSIRAPAGGAISRLTLNFLVMGFQSAPLREGRCGDTALTLASYFSFNPRPCGRGDSRTTPARSWTMTSFNPRPCGRGDVRVARLPSGSVIVSIRAPAGGAIGCDK